MSFINNTKTYLDESSEGYRSVAEDYVFQELHKIGLNDGLLTNYDIPFTTKEAEYAQITKCNLDGYYKYIYVYYHIDGPHHIRNKIMWKDQRIDKILSDRGWEGMRYPFEPPFTSIDFKEFLKQLRPILQRNNYERLY